MTHYGLQFDAVESPRQLRQLGDFLRTHVGTYDPAAHNAWLEQTCLPAIARDERRAIGWWQDGRMVGDAVIRVVGPGTAELKNFRVAPRELAGRGMGAFLLRQAEAEAVELLTQMGMVSIGANDITLQLDTTEGGSAQAFFAHHGFSPTGVAELYTPGRNEVLMARTLRLG